MRNNESHTGSDGKKHQRKKNRWKKKQVKETRKEQTVASLTERIGALQDELKEVQIEVFKLEEKEKKVARLEESLNALQDKLKEKQVQIKKVANTYQLYEPILKSVRITFNVQTNTDLPFYLKENGELTVLLERTAHYYAINGSTHIMKIELTQETCDTQTSHIFNEDLGENCQLVFSLKYGRGIHETKTCPITRNKNSTQKVDFNEKIQFSVHITKETKSDIEKMNRSLLCQEEKEYLEKRKQFVFEKLKENLYGLRGTQNKEFVSSLEDVPNIAIIGSGGGMRAVIGMSGAMTALSENQFLDYAMYTAGLSGSAWYLSTLYAYDEHLNPMKVNEHIRRKLNDNTGTYIRMGLRIVIYWAVCITCFPARKINCTELFGEMIGRLLLDKKCEGRWSEQAEKFKGGCIPLPLMAALHVRHEKTRNEYNEWIEISPYQVLLPRYGSAIKMKTFGDKFFGGFCGKLRDEKPIHFLQGICGSAYAIARDKRPQENKSNLSTKSMANMYLKDRILYWFNKFDTIFVGRVPNFLHRISGFRNISVDQGKKHLSTVRSTDEFTQPDGQGRCKCKCHSFIGGVLDTCCRTLKNFTLRLLGEICGTVLLNLSNKAEELNPADPYTGTLEDDNEMLIVDAGIEFNSPYPLVLHPAREIELILSFDFSDRGRDKELPFEELKKAANWANHRGVPFPKLYPDLHLMEEEWKKGNRKEVYIFQGYDAPTIMHFVMINKSFRNSGTRTKTSGENKQFDIHPNYDTMRFSYSTEEFDKFNELVQHNVNNNMQEIFDCIVMRMELKEECRMELESFNDIFEDR